MKFIRYIYPLIVLTIILAFLMPTGKESEPVLSYGQNSHLEKDTSVLPPQNGYAETVLFKEIASDLSQDSTLPASIEKFSIWTKKFATANGQEQKELISKGVELAKQRMYEMEQLLFQEPEKALKHALSYQEYAHLPEAIKPFVEKPFSRQANLRIYPIESSSGKTTGHNDQEDVLVYLETTDEDQFTSERLHLYGKRQGIHSKDGIAVQGVELNGVAAVYDTPLQIIPTEGVAFISNNYPEHAPGLIKYDALTGEAISGSVIVTLAGGEIFYFSSVENIRTLNNKLFELEKRPHPKVSSRVLFASPAGSGSGGTILVESISAAEALADSWTTTKKTVFIIRIDFPDKPGEPVAKTTLETDANTASETIREFSYGKTWLETTVSQEVVRVPSDSTYYCPADSYTEHKNDELHLDAQVAFNALNTGIDLSSFDIIGIYFTEIGCSLSDGFHYAGLGTIGGGTFWIQNDPYPELLTHEIGHNYGLWHASFWDTNGSSAVGEGVNDEYGDIFDVMGKGWEVPRPHFHMQGKSSLNWITSAQQQTVTRSGVYRLYRFDHADATQQLTLRIPKGENEYYWLGYRQQYIESQVVNGRPYFNNEWLSNGVYIIWEKNSSAFFSKSWLIDTTPGSANGRKDSAIMIGQTYEDAAIHLSITPIAKGGVEPEQWIDVQIEVNTPPAFAEVKIPGTANARVNTVLRASATDANDDSISYHWDFGNGDTVDTISTSVEYQWPTDGNFMVNVTANDGAGGKVTRQSQIIVSNPSPVFTEVQIPGTANARVNTVLRASATDANDDGISYHWDFGNGDTTDTTSTSINYQWPIGGTFTVSVTASDGAGGNTFRQSQITVTDPLLNWTQRQSNTSQELRLLAKNSNTLLAIGGYQTVLSSLDGAQWTVLNTNLYSGVLLRDLIHDGEKWVAVGYNYDSSAGAWVSFIGTSVDGATWVRRYSGESQLFAITTRAGLSVVVGDNGTVLSSVNGIDWQPRQSGSMERLSDVTNNGTTFVAVFNCGNTIISTDGITWEAGPIGSFNELSFLHDHFITTDCGGRLSFAASNNLQFSSSNITGSPSKSGLTYGMGIYFAHSTYTSQILDNFVSLNGEKWYRYPVSAQDSRNDAIFFNNTFITVGQNGSIWQSDPLSINEDSDGDGIPSALEIAWGLDPTNANDANGDLDGDGVSNLAEYQAGRNPLVNEAVAISSLLLKQSSTSSSYGRQSERHRSSLLMEIIPAMVQGNR